MLCVLCDKKPVVLCYYIFYIYKIIDIILWLWCGCGVVWLWCGCGVVVVWLWCGCGGVAV